ncbi:hypothetical protein [Nodosilinea nodulosa]|uniref:hypothetical protein n=1 Tax=Nodosilinea nodulosa TaxID=416001 RepID=UPI0003727824|nr:hypothetical protein [Nodosilinea nodulosa]
MKVAFHWGLVRPQAISYGLLLILASVFGIGDFLLLVLGLLAIIGGVWGIYERTKAEQAEPNR